MAVGVGGWRVLEAQQGAMHKYSLTFPGTVLPPMSRIHKLECWRRYTTSALANHVLLSIVYNSKQVTNRQICKILHVVLLYRIQPLAACSLCDISESRTCLVCNNKATNTKLHTINKLLA